MYTIGGNWSAGFDTFLQTVCSLPTSSSLRRKSVGDPPQRWIVVSRRGGRCCACMEAIAGEWYLHFTGATYGLDGIWWCIAKLRFMDSVYTMAVTGGDFYRPPYRKSEMESGQLTATRAEQSLPSGGFAHGKGRLWEGGGPETEGGRSSSLLPSPSPSGSAATLLARAASGLSWLARRSVVHGVGVRLEGASWSNDAPGGGRRCSAQLR